MQATRGAIPLKAFLFISQGVGVMENEKFVELSKNQSSEVPYVEMEGCKCSHCNGTGVKVDLTTPLEDGSYLEEVCQFCHGDGTVNEVLDLLNNDLEGRSKED
jgi:hypothetical protein